MFKRLFRKTATPGSEKTVGVVAIVVNFFTEDFLFGLLKILSAEPAIDRIVIANNGSTSALSLLTAEFSKTEILNFEENIGFGAAVNRAAQEFPAEYFLVVNPDTLPDAGFAGQLLLAARQHNALIAGPRFFWDDRKTFRLPPALGYSWKIAGDMQLLQTSGTDAKLVSHDWVLRHDRFWQQEEPFSEPFLSGACMLIRNDKDFFADGKIFDERFFLYYEDTDLCLRAFAQNKTMIVVPHSEVVHYWDQSPSDQKGKLMEESRNKFLLKHYGQIPEISLPAQASASTPDITDLGTVTENTIFTFDNKNISSELFFEFGLNVHFVPFAQALMTGNSFQITQPVLSRLKPGEYYSRIRSKNQTLKIWKWRKP